MVDTDRVVAQLVAVESKRQVIAVDHDVTLARIAAFDSRITDVRGLNINNHHVTTIHATSRDNLVTMVGELVDPAPCPIVGQNGIHNVEARTIKGTAIARGLVVDDGRTADVNVVVLIENGAAASVVASRGTVAIKHATHDVGLGMAITGSLAMQATTCVVLHQAVGHVQEVHGDDIATKGRMIGINLVTCQQDAVTKARRILSVAHKLAVFQTGISVHLEAIAVVGRNLTIDE